MTPQTGEVTAGISMNVMSVVLSYRKSCDFSRIANRESTMRPLRRIVANSSALSYGCFDLNRNAMRESRQVFVKIIEVKMKRHSQYIRPGQFRRGPIVFGRGWRHMLLKNHLGDKYAK